MPFIPLKETTALKRKNYAGDAIALLIGINCGYNFLQYLHFLFTMTLDEFKKQFIALRDKGFVKTRRSGPTGIGQTFEAELELEENNLALPDIPGFEIKTHREQSSSMVTLFTFNKKAWLIPQLDAIEKYGSFDKNSRKGLYYTLAPSANSAGLFTIIEEGSLFIRHTSGENVVSWRLEDLVKRFKKKVPALLFITARVEERDGVEYFHFYRAQIMQGTSDHLIKHLLLQDDLKIDLRLHARKKSARNHGTGFRISENKLPELFSEIKDVC